LNKDRIISRLGYLSPLGWLELQATEHGLAAILFSDIPVEGKDESPFLLACKQDLDAFFAGNTTPFSVPLDMEGTDFQKRVWAELIAIPFGETVSYLHIAQKLGDPNSTRAVGNANGKNPIPILVPCHRVIGAGGSLVGYSGGMEKKKWLLEFERNLTKKDLFNSLSNHA
jgi:methylated-DNA-[protein]-cysteine S-methyltransferase